ncbi:GNAT family N-acetyltransferase [Bacillus sp. R1-10]
MYLRERVPKNDDKRLLKIAKDNFRIENSNLIQLLDKSDKVIVLCNKKGFPIGFISYSFISNKSMYVHYLAIASNYVGRGIASSFITEFFDYLKRQGVKGITGYVTDDNIVANTIYKRWGFKEILKMPKGKLIATII